jgi:hypothetical protein
MSSEEITALTDSVQPRKPSRVRKFKEDYVNDLTILRMDHHALECHAVKLEMANAYLLNQINHPSIRFALGMLVKAVKGWCK